MSHFVEDSNLVSKGQSYYSKMCEVLENGEEDAVIANFPLDDYYYQLWKRFVLQPYLHKKYYIYIVYEPIKAIAKDLDFDCLVIDTIGNPRQAVYILEECFLKGLYGFTMNIVISTCIYEELRPSKKCVFLKVGDAYDSLYRMRILR